MMNGIPAWSVAGKPTDAVIIGLYALKLNPVLIVSGINIGENLSFESIMTSGTVGAALEGSNQGTKGIAFSLQVEDQGDKFDDPRHNGQNFDAAKKVVRDVVSRILDRRILSPRRCDQCQYSLDGERGAMRSPAWPRNLFQTGVEKRVDPRGRPYFWINGPLLEDAEEGTDVHAIRKGNISITPITLDCTAYEAEKEARDVFFP